LPIVSVPSRRKKKNGPPKYKWKKERKIRVILVYDSVVTAQISNINKIKTNK